MLFRLHVGNYLFAQIHCYPNKVLVGIFKCFSTILSISQQNQSTKMAHKSQKHWPSQPPVLGNTGLLFSQLCYTCTDIWEVSQFCKRPTSVTALPPSQHDTSVRWESMHSADIVLCLSAAPDIPTPGIWLLYSPQLSSHSNSSLETPAARGVTKQHKQFKQSSLWERGGSLRGVRMLHYHQLLLDLWKWVIPACLGSYLALQGPSLAG